MNGMAGTLLGGVFELPFPNRITKATFQFETGHEVVLKGQTLLMWWQEYSFLLNYQTALRMQQMQEQQEVEQIMEESTPTVSADDVRGTLFRFEQTQGELVSDDDEDENDDTQE